jgi:hypothetical protein
LPLFFALVLGLLIGPILARYRLVLIPFYLLWAGVTLGVLYEKKKWLCGIVFLGLPFLAFCMNNTLNPSLKDRPTERNLVALIQEENVLGR